MSVEPPKVANYVEITVASDVPASELQRKGGRGIFSTSRVEAFSDGVIAIAITLLILEIKPPNFDEVKAGKDLLEVLAKEGSSYIAYLLSFVGIGIIWVNHHIMFKYIQRIDRLLLNLNLLMLLAVSFTPFPTALLGRAISELQGSVAAQVNTAAAIYNATMLLMGISFTLMWQHAIRHGLVDRTTDATVYKLITRTSRVGTALYMLGFIVSLFSWQIAIIFDAAVALIYLLPSPTDRFWD